MIALSLGEWFRDQATNGSLLLAIPVAVTAVLLALKGKAHRVALRVVTLFLVIGTLLWAYYQQTPLPVAGTRASEADTTALGALSILSAMARPEPQAWVHPSVPCPVSRNRLR